MDVQLYVYDLSQGLARALSVQFLGIHIDAVYHTSLVFGGIEYFYGRGVQMCYPGTTHHGRPMEIIPLGQTHLPSDIVAEYLESLKEIYTAESYDLFAHNCNNFTHDFSMFLLGKGIPEHITSLPRTVLNTPFGAMLKRQIDQTMRPIVQAPLPSYPQPASHRNGTIAVRSAGTLSTQNAPDHPHQKLNLPLYSRSSTEPIIYKRPPPLAKLTVNLPENTTQSPNFKSAVSFLSHSNPKNAPIPDVAALASFLRASASTVPTESLFALYDLARAMLADPRVSGTFAELDHGPATIAELLGKANGLGAECPYKLRLVTLQLCCSLFSSPLMTSCALGNSEVASEVVKAASDALLPVEQADGTVGSSSSTANLKLAASHVTLNIATAVNRKRVSPAATRATAHGQLDEALQVELLASVLSALSSDAEFSADVTKALVLAVGSLAYCADVHGEVVELCRVMDAKRVVLRKRDAIGSGDDKALASEIGNVLLGQGLDVAG